MVRRVLCLGILVAAGVVALGYEASVDVAVRWRVLPYQSLSVIGSAEDSSRVFLLRANDPAAPAEARERVDPLSLHVASNIPWRLLLRLDGPASPGLEARCETGEYALLSEIPVVVASGPHGTYDVAVELRWAANGVPDGREVRLTATIMPE